VIPRVVVAANWKMHKGPDDARAFLTALRPSTGPRRPLVLVFPPAVSLAAALAARRHGIGLGVQNIHWEDAGAFTGELSAPLARAAGATHTLVGHSERRQLFGETDADVARKASAALRHALTPVVCVGETLAERRAGRVDEVILRQLDAALGGLGAGGDFLIAYEPVWAIGTGENATPQDAGEAHGTLRRRLVERLGPRGRDIPILYGGSVKPDNAAALMAAPDVDGVLVGGASLDPGSFARILEAAPDR
jgi:triosephosphate isomerase